MGQLLAKWFQIRALDLPGIGSLDKDRAPILRACMDQQKLKVVQFREWSAWMLLHPSLVADPTFQRSGAEPASACVDVVCCSLLLVE